MAELINWQEALVVQTDRRLGAIPAGFEWMARFNKVRDVNLETFQEDFNLQAKGGSQNNFHSIAEAVKQRYPQLLIKYQSFREASEKIAFIKDLVEENIPCMISMSISSKQDISHQMPVVYCDDVLMRMVWMVNDTKSPDLLRTHHDDIINRHNYWPSGRDVAWLEPSA